MSREVKRAAQRGRSRPGSFSETDPNRRRDRNHRLQPADVVAPLGYDKDGRIALTPADAVLDLGSGSTTGQIEAKVNELLAAFRKAGMLDS